MADYIKRADAIKAITRKHDEVLSVAEAIEDLESVPSAVVREIKRGRWSFDNIIFTDSDGVSKSAMWGYKCSECGGFCIGESNFCPNCGADMRHPDD